MRHQKQKNPGFGRQGGPKKALIRGLINSLVEKERIKTTVTKAKHTRPLIEKAVTMGKRGDIHSRRLLLSRYPNKKTVDKILNVLSPRFKDRSGGYTRIIKLGFRSGDKAPLAYLEFVDYNVHQAGFLTDTKTPAKKDTKTLAKETTSVKKDKKTPAKKATPAKKSSKISDSKKQKKQALATIDKKRKKARLKQKKSRRINR